VGAGNEKNGSRFAVVCHRHGPVGAERSCNAPRTGGRDGLLKRAVGRVSLVLFIAMHLACLLVILYPPTWPLVLLALGSYVLRMWAITAGYHRYFAHRTFHTSRAFQLVLALLGASAMQNGPIWWASWHRRHHKFVDTPEDPHSPVVYGFWYAHMAWVFDPKNDVSDLFDGLVEDAKRVKGGR